MSREIKFRAWYKAEQKFLYGFENIYDHDFVINFNGEVGTCDEDGFFMSFKDIELNCYTGLKDCKGRKIFEGDILRFGSCVEVVFYEPTMGRFMTKLQKSNDESEIGEISSLSRYYTDNYKVIGNIHENLELLK